MMPFTYESIISEQKYRDYTIKKVRKAPHGIVYAVYRDDNLVIWDTSETRAKLSADWDEQYNR